MNNPVLCPSGHYYEKSAIINWIKKENTDPLTRERLTIDMLIEDEEYKKKLLNIGKNIINKIISNKNFIYIINEIYIW